MGELKDMSSYSRVNRLTVADQKSEVPLAFIDRSSAALGSTVLFPPGKEPEFSLFFGEDNWSDAENHSVIMILETCQHRLTISDRERILTDYLECPVWALAGVLKLVPYEYQPLIPLSGLVRIKVEGIEPDVAV